MSNPTEQVYHTPVLLSQSVEGMNLMPRGGTYADLTFGGGGHSREILRRMAPDARLLSFDQDADAIGNTPDDERFTFVRGNFRYLKNFLRYYDAGPIDAILADLGVSSHHLDEGERGFSFRFPQERLDMRMNRQGGMTAADVLQNYTAEQLTQIFRLYGELKPAYKLAEAVVKARQQQPIDTIERLTAIATPLLPRDRERKELTKLFQALRIEVNHELDALKEMLESTTDVLRPGGRLVVITYHSLEDRLVKNFMKSGNTRGEIEKDFFGRTTAPFRTMQPAFILPDEEEIARNPRARSAKLRIAERV